MILPTITSLLMVPPEPFISYYHNYVCNVQDKIIDDEIAYIKVQLYQHSEISQLKHLQKLIHTT